MVDGNSPVQTPSPDAPAVENTEETSALEAYDRYENGLNSPTPSDESYFADEKAEAAAKAAAQPDLAKTLEPVPEQEFEFVHKGRQVKGPLSKILKWASQGYDYAQSMAEINKTREETNQLAETYRPIDEWVGNNPDKWDRLQKAIELEKQGLGEIDPSNPLLNVVQGLQKELADIQAERQTVKAKTEDEALDAHIKSIREKHSDLDWKSADEYGLDREARVIRHANKNGFPTFEAAFKDLYFDELLTLKESKAREAVSAEKTKQIKQGVVTGKAPSLRPKRTDTKKSWDSLSQEALDELKAGAHG